MGFISNSQLKAVEQTLVDNLKNEILIPGRATKAAIAEYLETTLGNEDQTPFSFNTVGINSDVETGMQKINKLVGVDLVKNQYAKELNSTNFATANGSVSYNSGVATFTASAQGGMVYSNYSLLFHKHVYFAKADIKLTTGTTNVYLRVQGVNRIATENKTDWQTLCFIYESTLENDSSIAVRDERTSNWDAIQIKNLELIDLNQRYGFAAVVNAILGSNNTNAQKIANLIAFDPQILKDLSYDPGSFVTSKSEKLKTVGYNQWDEEIESGKIVDGVLTTDSLCIRTKNYIRIIPNTQYYVKQPNSYSVYGRLFFYDANENYIGKLVGSNYANRAFTTPANASYMKAYWDGSTYNNDICIFLYWDGSLIKYEPYDEHVYELPNSDLHGTLQVDGNGKIYADGDEQYPEGKKKTRYGSYTFTGSESWIHSGSAYYFAKAGGIGIQSYTTSQRAKIVCEFATAATCNSLYSGGSGIGSTNSNIWIDSTLYANKSNLMGKTIYFELATEVESESTPFPENFYGDDFGTMQFLDEDGNEIAGLQGVEILYKADIAGFAESLYSKADGDPDAFALKTDVSEAVNGLEKALEDGTLIPSKALTAKELEPVSDESGTIQDTPFISQGTATANGTSATPTGPVGKQLEKQGNALVANQLAKELNSTNWGTISASASYSGGVATFTATAQYGNINLPDMPIVTGHRYFCTASIKLTTATTNVQLYVNGGNGVASTAAKTDWQTLFIAFTGNADSAKYIIIKDDRASDWDAIQVREVYLVDLTQMENGAIPPDLVSYPEHFSRYYNGSMANNAGSLEVSNGRYLVCTGRQLWNEQTEVANINVTTGAKESANNRLISKYDEPTKAVAGATYHVFGSAQMFYYDANDNFISASAFITNNTFVVPSKCQYIRFRLQSDYGTTYKHDITISLYYPPEQGGEGYDQYYAYVEPKVYDTGTEQLLAFDTKHPDGAIDHNTGTIADISQREINQSGSLFLMYVSTMAQNDSESDRNKGIKCSRFVVDSQTQIDSAHMNDFTMLKNSKIVYFKDSTCADVAAFKEKYAGVSLQYLLATPTTSQGTPFSENIEIDDYGMMYWLDSDGNLVSIPQGTKLFYVAWYAGFIDDLHKLTDGDGTNVLPKTVKVSDVMESLPANAPESLKQVLDLIAANHAIEQANAGGMLRHQLADKKSIDFLNTDCVDLGTLTYNYRSTFTNPCFEAAVSGIAQGTNNLLATIYKQVDKTKYEILENMEIACRSGQAVIYIRNTTYTDAAAFKAAMKGMLLAFEKASS